MNKIIEDIELIDTRSNRNMSPLHKQKEKAIQIKEKLILDEASRLAKLS
jgi:hypothetical protein